MVFAVNALPTVRIVVSAAENITRGEDLTAMDLDPMERLGNLVMEYTTGDDNVQSVVLFCGYVLTETPALAVSISSMRSTISYQLVCAAGAISAIPYGGLEYYSLGGSDTNNLRSTSYSDLIPFEEMQNKGAWTALNKDFQPSPPTALAKMLDILRRNFAKDDKSMTPLLDIFVDGCGGLSIKPITGSMLMPTMAHQCIPALRGSPPLTIFLALLRQVYLGFFPQTVGERNTPCKLVTAPLNPWSDKRVDKDHSITAKDILSIQAQTQYQLDQRIDYWVVKSQLLPNLIAAYGPGTGGETGKAVVMELEEFQKKITEMFKVGSINRAAARIISLPGWLSLMEIKQENAPEEKDAGNKTAPTGSIDEETLKDLARKVALTGFLTEGCSVTAVGLTVVPEFYFRSLCRLGEMMALDIPQMTADGMDDTPLRYYGLLDSMGMRITVERKDLQVTCSMHLSNVHDENIHETFQSSPPLYLNADTSKAIKAALDFKEQLNVKDSQQH